MSMMLDVYNQMVQAVSDPDDFDIPVCKNCLKSLDDPTHQIRREEDDLICLEPIRQECEECSEIFLQTEMLRGEDFEMQGVKYPVWKCKNCAAQ